MRVSDKKKIEVVETVKKDLIFRGEDRYRGSVFRFCRYRQVTDIAVLDNSQCCTPDL